MDTLYNKNGLVFWSEKEIRIRKMLVDYFVHGMRDALNSQNNAFEFIQVEAPILSPNHLINKDYRESDVFTIVDADRLVLRPETTSGSYAYAKHLMRSTSLKTGLPICIYQHGKSFRKEQDKVLSHMRLKEFYQLEFQCIYSESTKNDYSSSIIPAARKMISDMVGECRIESSDRVPSYSEWTQDIVLKSNDMELCSISLRNDYEGANVLEVSIGTDRCMYNFLKK